MISIVFSRPSFYSEYFLDQPSKETSSSKLGAKMLQQVFWFIQMTLFHQDSIKEIRYIHQQVSICYVKYFDMLGSHKDFFFKYLPFAMGTSVCLVYYFLFPASRHLYSETFKDCVFTEVYRLLSVRDGDDDKEQ